MQAINATMQESLFFLGGLPALLQVERNYRERQARKRATRRDPRRVLADLIEGEVQSRLIERGHYVTKTSHTANFDLLADGLRVEVKAATWASGRYGAALRDNQADVLVLACLGDATCFFVIPFQEVNGLRYFKIPNYDPRAYQGRFAPYFEKWDLIEAMIGAGVNHWQIPLLEV